MIPPTQPSFILLKSFFYAFTCQFSLYLSIHRTVLLSVSSFTPTSKTSLNTCFSTPFISHFLLTHQTFGATHDPLQLLPPIQPPYVVRIEGDEDPLYYRSQNVTRDELFNWIRSRSLPLLPEYRGRAYNDIVRSGKLTLLFALDSAALIDNEQIAQLKQVVRSLPVSVDSFGFRVK